MNPEIDVADYLGNTLSELTQNTNLWYGGVLAVDDYVPALAVFVMPTGGAQPLAFASDHGASEDYHTIQIIVRGGKNDYPEAKALAKTVYDQLKYAPLPGYCECKPLQSGPIYVGVDKDGHHTLSINYELIS